MIKSFLSSAETLFTSSKFILIIHFQKYRSDENCPFCIRMHHASMIYFFRAHFNNDNPEKTDEMAFRKSDVFHVVDTLHNGVVGAWQVFRMDPFLSGLGRAAEQVQKGVIPNKARAEEIATQQFNAAKKEQNTMEQSRGTSFFRRKRDKSAHHRRSKSLGKVNYVLTIHDSNLMRPKNSFQY